MQRLKYAGALLVLLLAAGTALAAQPGLTANTDVVTIPQLISYQGKLTDAAGNPLSGTYAMTFTIYDGVTSVWTETQNTVQVTDGIFNVLLGAVTPVSALPEAGNCSLEVEVNSEPITPKIPFVSVPYTYYADKADDADNLGGDAASTYMQNGDAAGGQLAGTYPSPNIAQLGATTGQYLQWNGTAWAPVTLSAPNFWTNSGSGYIYPNTPSANTNARIYGTGYVYNLYGYAGSSYTYGVYGQCGSSYSYGVYGYTATSYANAVYGYSSTAYGYGVQGYNAGSYCWGSLAPSYYMAYAYIGAFGYTGSYTYSYGVYGYSYPNYCTAVYGFAYGNYSYGTYGYCDYNYGYGAYGYTAYSYSNGVGGYSSSYSTYGLLGAGYYPTYYPCGAYGYGYYYPGVYGYNGYYGTRGELGSYSYNAGVYGYSSSYYGGYFYSGYSYGTYFYNTSGYYARVNYSSYKIYGSGSVSTYIIDENDMERTLHCPEAPGVVFEDYGSSQLVNGHARVEIDPLLLRGVTVNEQHPLRVYVTPTTGEAIPLGVSKGATSFDVYGPTGSGATFDWRIVATRKGYEDLRFEAHERPIERRGLSEPTPANAWAEGSVQPASTAPEPPPPKDPPAKQPPLQIQNQ